MKSFWLRLAIGMENTNEMESKNPQELRGTNWLAEMDYNKI